MELTVLGKYGPYPKAGATACSGYMLKEKDTMLVMDFGSGTLARLQEIINIKEITAIYLTHLHFDHTSDLLPFRYLLEDLDHTVTIYAPFEDSPWYKILLMHPKFNVINIDENSVVKCGDFVLSFFLTDHPVTNYAIRVKGNRTFIYTGDMRFNQNIYKSIEGADCILADCAKPVDFKGPHMTIDKAIELHKTTKIRILATHLSPDYCPKKDFEPYDDITVVEEQQTYFI